MRPFAICAAAACLCRVATAAAQTVPPVPPAPAAGVAAAPAENDASWWQRKHLLGDIGGLRPLLGNAGISLDLTETGEVFGNLTGGIDRGFEYAGLTNVTVEIGTRKAFGWAGGTVHASALQIHGRDLSADNLAVLQTVSNIDAERSTRLWELWYRQTLPRIDADVKFGQQSVDQDFLVNDSGSVFLNAMMGWPALPSNDLYGGAPVYPLSSLGARLRMKPAPAATVLAGVFDDNPPGGPFADDPQLRGGEASGTRFNLGTGALLIGELQYAVARPPWAVARADLPGTYKLGAWVDSGRFPDRRFDTAGLSLAAPDSTGIARLHRGNFSIYGIADQRVWRSLSLFGRVMGAPGDRNPIDWSLNAGLSLKAPLPGRGDDIFGIGYGWAHLGGRQSAFDEDVARFNGSAFPIGGAEQVIEATYQYRIAPWWLLQPDLQYVVDPGGGAPNPLAPARRVGDEMLLGLRTVVTF